VRTLWSSACLVALLFVAVTLLAAAPASAQCGSSTCQPVAGTPNCFHCVFDPNGIGGSCCRQFSPCGCVTLHCVPCGGASAGLGGEVSSRPAAGQAGADFAAFLQATAPPTKTAGR
jgi:hypothetical protein